MLHFVSFAVVIFHYCRLFLADPITGTPISAIIIMASSCRLSVCLCIVAKCYILYSKSVNRKCLPRNPTLPYNFQPSNLP